MTSQAKQPADATTQASADDLEDFIVIARIARPQGIRGEVIADVLTDFPERFAELGEVHLTLPNGKRQQRTVERARFHQGRVILKLAACDTRNEAELLRDVRVMIPASAALPLPKDEYYHFDLQGCAVEHINGTALGVVAEIQDFGAAPLLVVKQDERELLIPLANSICVVVDVAHKRIVVDPPEGLLDL